MNTFEKPVVEVISDSPTKELLIEDIHIGDGAESSAGQLISVDYVGAVSQRFPRRRVFERP